MNLSIKLSEKDRKTFSPELAILSDAQNELGENIFIDFYEL